MAELLAHLLTIPLQIVVGTTKFVSERFGHGGIADRMIYLNGYPFLDSKEEHTFGVPVSTCMSSHITALPATGMQLRQLERIVGDNAFQGYPVVEEGGAKVLVGYVGRTELRYAIGKARDEGVASTAKCYFTSMPTSSSAGNTSFDTIPATSSTAHLDLSRYMDPTPLSVHPRLPLETVMELFKKMGPRVILIEYRGRLTGLVTVKDCLKYQFKVEAGGHAGGSGGGGDEAGMERLWGWIKGGVDWINGKVGRGEVRLTSPVTRSARRDGGANDEGVFAVGDDEGGDRYVELEDRGR